MAVLAQRLGHVVSTIDFHASWKFPEPWCSCCPGCPSPALFGEYCMSSEFAAYFVSKSRLRIIPCHDSTHKSQVGPSRLVDPTYLSVGPVKPVRLSFDLVRTGNSRQISDLYSRVPFRRLMQHCYRYVSACLCSSQDPEW